MIHSLCVHMMQNLLACDTQFSRTYDICTYNTHLPHNLIAHCVAYTRQSQFLHISTQSIFVFIWGRLLCIRTFLEIGLKSDEPSSDLLLLLLLFQQHTYLRSSLNVLYIL